MFNSRTEEQNFLISDRKGHGVPIEQKGDPPRLGCPEHLGDVRRSGEQAQLRLQDLRLRLRQRHHGQQHLRKEVGRKSAHQVKMCKSC